MKTPFPLVLCALVSVSWPMSAAPTAPVAPSVTEPVIQAVRGRMVSISVPAGYDRVTVQVLVPQKNTKNRAVLLPPVWKTLSVRFPKKQATSFQVRLAKLTPKRNLQVLGSRDDSLPESFLGGTTTFPADPVKAAAATTTGSSPGGLLSNTSVNLSGATDGKLAAPNSSIASGSLVAGDSNSAQSRTVAEADIWKLSGDRLYFFNQLRGLQIFDMKDPAEPVLMGTLRMPAVGEDMYVLDSGEAVLLKKATTSLWDDWSWGGGVINFGLIRPVAFDSMVLQGTRAEAGTGTLSLGVSPAMVSKAQVLVAPQQKASEQSEIVIAAPTAGKPAVLARVPFEGTLRESRLVGSVLYVATDIYKAATDTTDSQWGCQVSSFDLSDPAHPVARDAVFVGGWASAVMATDRYLFVAKSYPATLSIVDISAPNGAMIQQGEIDLPGTVDNKFNLDLNGDTLSVVSAVSGYVDSQSNPVDWGAATWRSDWHWVNRTSLNTYSLADAAHPVALGDVQFADGETVRSARFDNGRAYVVTFRQVDPLWIFDLKDPAKPTIAGHVQAPGFSTYIEPLGDRLVTVGLVNWQPAVSLFDVSDVHAPKLLQQLVLKGASDSWNSSEAVWNEKAFNVVPEENLIMLPLSGYDPEGGDAGRLQFIDLFADSLVKRGVLTARFAPRRSAVQGKNIYSISPTKLVSVNAANRDKPVVKAAVEIAWPVDRVFAVGSHLVQIGGRTVTVSPQNDPEASLASYDLPTTGSVSGATVRDGVLYVVQAPSGYYWEEGAVAAKAQTVYLSTFSLAELPAIKRSGVVSTTLLSNNDWWYQRNFTPLWPSPVTLVWSTAGASQYWAVPYWYDQPAYQTWSYVPPVRKVTGADLAVDEPGSYDLVTVDPAPAWQVDWRYANTQCLYAFNVADTLHPLFASALELGKGKPWIVADPLVAEGNILVSYKHLGAVYADANRALKDADAPSADVLAARSLTNRHFLLKVDYDDPTTPVPEENQPNLPGRLVGLSKKGILLYTIGQQLDPVSGVSTPDTLALHASALDSSGVHLLDSLPLPANGAPFAQSGETLFLLKPEASRTWVPSSETAIWWSGAYADNPRHSVLETWTVGDNGKFVAQGQLELDHESNLSLFGGLAVAHGGSSLRSVYLGWGDIGMRTTYLGLNCFGWMGGNSRTLHFVDAVNPLALSDLGTYTFDGGIYPNLTFADGDDQRGLWVPLGDYGVEPVAVPAPSAP